MPRPGEASARSEIRFEPALSWGGVDDGGQLNLSDARLDLDELSGMRFGGQFQASPTLLGRYRQALERESQRLRFKDPTQGWLTDKDEDETPAEDARRQAGRLFRGASNRILSQTLEKLVEESAPLRQVRDYAEGVRFDVRRGGGVTVGAGRGAEPAANIAARFNLVVGSKPRVEMRSTLPGGIRTRLEMTLTSPGLRASFSRRLSGHFNGTLAGGYEDGGEERWFSAGLGVTF